MDDEELKAGDWIGVEEPTRIAFAGRIEKEVWLRPGEKYLVGRVTTLDQLSEEAAQTLGGVLPPDVAFSQMIVKILNPEPIIVVMVVLGSRMWGVNRKSVHRVAAPT